MPPRPHAGKDDGHAVVAHPEFRDHYARAREAQMDHWADEIIDIADDAGRDVSVDNEGNQRVNGEAIARSRLRVDTRKWIMSNFAPRKYGDRVTQELVGKDDGPIEITDQARAKALAVFVVKTRLKGEGDRHAGRRLPNPAIACVRRRAIYLNL
jgi:hypothetical protein